MKKDDLLYQQYINILREELRPAMGCTEPIALAYAGAKARQILGCIPQRVRLFVSGNIIKNVKSVTVPNTGGLHGLAAAICVGIVAGDADKELEVISQVDDEGRAALRRYLDTVDLDIQAATSELVFDMDVYMEGDGNSVRLRMNGIVDAVVSGHVPQIQHAAHGHIDLAAGKIVVGLTVQQQINDLPVHHNGGQACVVIDGF